MFTKSKNAALRKERKQLTKKIKGNKSTVIDAPIDQQELFLILNRNRNLC